MNNPTAVLCLKNSEDEFIIIPVQNFPILPVGSLVDLTIDGGEIEFNELIIESYSVSNIHGTQIQLEYVDTHGEPNKVEKDDATWLELSKLCADDTMHLGDWRYSKIIDFCPKGSSE